MKNRFVSFLSIISMILSASLSAAFIPASEHARAYVSPGKPTGFVNDFANVIDDETQASFETDLSNFAKETSNQIAVATLPNLSGDSIENVANELFREWGVGGKERSNGVLILVAVEDRQTRIEVGYGLEGAITDLESGRIVDYTLLPAFRENDYAGGITKAASQIKEAVAGEFNVAETERQTGNSVPNIFLNSFYYGLFAFVWMGSFLARSKSFWAGGVIGLIAGTIGLFTINSTLLKIILLATAPPLGLLLDWLVSRNYKANIARGGNGGFLSTYGGFSSGSGSSGGFGGFGGGSSGGRGNSGSW